jgi:hypothetical protein
VPTTGLVGYWKLDETSGTRYDSSGNSNHLINNNVGSGIGKFDRAADFEANNKSDLAITDADQSSLDITGHLTIAAWIKPETISGSDGIIITKYNNDNNQRAYRISLYNDGLRFIVSPNGTDYYYASVSPTNLIGVGEWTHIAGVWDGNYLRVYINGRLVPNCDISTSLCDTNGNNPRRYTGGIFNSNARFMIANQDNLPNTQYPNGLYFDGMMDDVRIYKRSLNSNEIMTVYNYVPPGNSCNISLGDVNGDGYQTIADAANLAADFLKEAKDRHYNTDFNCDTYVDLRDVAILVSNFLR